MLFPYFYTVFWGKNIKEYIIRRFLEFPLISSAEKDKVAGIGLNLPTKETL